MMNEATSKAERIRASRGNYEAEVTCTGEAGLHQCALMCPKNPGHDNFIPTKKFNIEHLPSRYRDNLIMDLVRATSDVTCRLSGSHISEDRPETWPDSEKAFPFSADKGENFNMVGTGWVYQVDKYTQKSNLNCKCDECLLRPGTHKPEKAWGKVYIQTANHVVYNTEEAKHTKCQFFYDSHETDINTVLTLTGLKVLYSDIKKDMCVMEYVTQDVELLDRFEKMWSHWEDLRRKVQDKYVFNSSPTFSVDPNLCIVVSHPHGCTKVISVGTWTHLHVIDRHNITSSYNTPTCPGSSGAPVTILGMADESPAETFLISPHSQGGPGNDNSSGNVWEFVVNL